MGMGWQYRGAMPMTPKIEPARKVDALPTLTLTREVLAEGRYFVTRPEELRLTLEDREREIAVLTEAENSCFLVARLPGVRVAGFLVVNGGALARTRHLGRLEVIVGAAFRQMGVGSALLDSAIEWAQQSPLVRKLSLAVLADNTTAVQLYRSRGFVEEGRRVAEYIELDGTPRDDLLMALYISPSSAHSASRR
jgi:ribosomal protein S18 acetylase RimI-like enzyme